MYILRRKRKRGSNWVTCEQRGNLHWRRQEFYYFDFGWGTLTHFPASIDKFFIFPIHFSNFGEGTFPLFPHPGGAYDLKWISTKNNKLWVGPISEISFQLLWWIIKISTGLVAVIYQECKGCLDILLDYQISNISNILSIFRETEIFEKYKFYKIAFLNIFWDTKFPTGLFIKAQSSINIQNCLFSSYIRPI